MTAAVSPMESFVLLNMAGVKALSVRGMNGRAQYVEQSRTLYVDDDMLMTEVFAVCDRVFKELVDAWEPPAEGGVA